MKIKARVDLSKSCRILMWVSFLALIGGLIGDLIGKQGVAQENEDRSWRRTNRGWEYAHSVPFDSKLSTWVVPTPRQTAAILVPVPIYRMALPVALFSFIVTLSYWSLSEVPNRGIVRRLGSAK